MPQEKPVQLDYRSNGAVGSTGNTGSTGTTGYTGNTGNTGSTGSTANRAKLEYRLYRINRQTGFTGNTGQTGSTGQQGRLDLLVTQEIPVQPDLRTRVTCTGNTGSTGSTGQTGQTGNTGANRVNGINRCYWGRIHWSNWKYRAHAGSTGSTGNTGFTGNTGNTGSPVEPAQPDQPGQPVQLELPAATGPGGAFGTDYIFAYDTTNQAMAFDNTYQIITVNTTVYSNGWTQTSGTFVCPAAGTYPITFNANVLVQESGLVFFAFQGYLPTTTTVIPGSEVVSSTDANSQVNTVSGTFMYQFAANQNFQMRWACGKYQFFLRNGYSF